MKASTVVVGARTERGQRKSAGPLASSFCAHSRTCSRRTFVYRVLFFLFFRRTAAAIITSKPRRARNGKREKFPDRASFLFIRCCFRNLSWRANRALRTRATINYSGVRPHLFITPTVSCSLYDAFRVSPAAGLWNFYLPVHDSISSPPWSFLKLKNGVLIILAHAKPALGRVAPIALCGFE